MWNFEGLKHIFNPICYLFELGWYSWRWYTTSFTVSMLEPTWSQGFKPRVTRVKRASLGTGGSGFGSSR